MTDDLQTPLGQPEESPMDYQKETPGDIQQAVHNAEQSITASSDEVNLAKERAAFETYVQTSGDSIPDNFQDAGTWFDSLKEAQKQFTQARQELSELKQHYTDEGTVNPNAVKTIEPTQEVASESVNELSKSSDKNPELRIKPQDKEAQVDEDQQSAGINQQDWDDWSYEVAATGALSENTKHDIMAKTGFSESMIHDFLSGQKAKMREAYSSAADVVGGTDKLQKMLQWASTSLSEEEQFAINSGMATNTMRDITLRGLASKYDSNIANNPITKEPEVPQNRINSSSATQVLSGYETQREFKVDRNNPRFNIEPKFRQAVEERMSKTNWNILPE